MYLEYYGLNDTPFRLAPDPRYLFKTESMLEALANLQYGIETGKGLVVVTGEVGTGKTTTLRVNLQSLDPKVLAAYIFNPLLTTSEFFDTLASEFRFPPQTSKAATLRMIGNMLVTRHSRGLRTVLIIDEAHLLPAHLLEEVRLLSNFETNREKLLQVVLCGQPELLDVLEQPGFRQLKQRVSLRCSIQPMNPYETREYIKWRLRVAGAKNDSIFDSAAMRIIHAVSGGIPRIINNLCDNALLSGFSQASPTVTGDVVNAVVGLLGLSGCEFSHGSGPEFSLANSGNEYLSAFEPKPVHRVAAAGASDLYDVLDSDEPLGPIAFDAPELAAHPVATSENRRENLRYIRPEYATYGRRTGDRANPRDNVRFVIEFDEPDARNPDAEFFSRVKVTRRS